MYILYVTKNVDFFPPDIAMTVVPPRKDERGFLVVVAGGRWGECVCAYERGEESEDESD